MISQSHITGGETKQRGKSVQRQGQCALKSHVIKRILRLLSL